MKSLDYNDIDLLSVWLSPSPIQIVDTIKNKFAGTAKNAVYFLDATSSFPLGEFQKAIPMSDKQVYDNIRITTCLDLQEALQIVNKVIQLLTMDKLQKQNSENDNDKPLEILILINGLNVMFQNTQIKEAASASHLILRDLLLKLRLIANNPQRDGSRLKSVLIFPKEEVSKYSPIHRDSSSKRLKTNAFSGNTLAEYIGKFYADLII